ncbi:Z1 domain-containing protein [Corynebacterium pseudogenitalium]|uniref:Z1 domain-containing protein n=1 Tax=Corynebacterium pseudogenitalium TaxID=38303 RepID=UPI003BA00510
MTSQFLDDYLATIDNEALKDGICKTIDLFDERVLQKFRWHGVHKTLMYGDVQSGKTSHALGVIANALDYNFEYVVFLTTDNLALVEQTYDRVFDAFPGAEVLEKTEVTRFERTVKKNRRSLEHSRPIIVVLTKNKNVLDNWLSVMKTSGDMANMPVLFIDDEADAASLNAKVRQGDVSRINQLLTDMQKISGAGIYVQLTGTPQAILLQAKIHNWRPDSHVAFKPGDKYIGGLTLFDELPNKYIRTFAKSELTEELEFKRAITSYAITCALLADEGSKACNMLIHQSRFKKDHGDAKKDVAREMNSLRLELDTPKGTARVEQIWQEDLQPLSGLEISLQTVIEKTKQFLDTHRVQPHIVNSDNKIEDQVDLKDGFHVLIGGDSLGRGLTIPKLQTVFYSRPSKHPQADTLWQHARMFGYDRDLRFLRVFMPLEIAKGFQEVHWGNEAIKKQLDSVTSIDDISIELDPKIRPARNNVIDPSKLEVRVGGRNYFADDPSVTNMKELDSFIDSIQGVDDEFTYINNRMAIEILKYINATKEDFPIPLFTGALQRELDSIRGAKTVLLVRKGRKVSAGKGTLLSPTDRALGEQFSNNTVLTLYRIEGNLGWSSDPVWVPNIKLPGNRLYYYQAE